jgi:PAS domain S-box-containing protein
MHTEKPPEAIAGRPDLAARGGAFTPGGRHIRVKICILCLAGITVLAGGGAVYLRERLADARSAAQRQLTTIADLKLHQIINWREERLADARFFSRARFVADDVEQFLAQPSREASRTAVRHWLDLLKGGDRYYAAVIFNDRLERCFALPETADESPTMLELSLNQALEKHDVVLADIHQDQPEGSIHLDVVFPIFKGAEVNSGAPMAVVLLKLDPGQFLFPLVQSWPIPSQTAETLLVRREGEDILYLNNLRHHSESALRLRLPMSSGDLPASRVLAGETEPVEGRDYRGVQVVAVGRRIPGTSWAIVAKVDQQELYAPLRRQMLAETLVLGGVVLTAALAVGLVWRQRSTHFLHRELALQKERAALAERVAHLMRNANDIILMMDPAGRVLEANECAQQNYGYSLEEMQQKSVRDLRAPEALPALESDFLRLKAEGAVFFETMHRRKDGSTFPVEVSSRKVSVGGETFLLSIVRDITERKRSDAQIQASLREKEILLKEIHHRVKNNMQVISSLVSMQAEEVEDQKLLALLEEVRNRVQSMALVHERLYQSENLAQVDFAVYAQELLDYLLRSYRSNAQVTLRLESDPIWLDVDTAVACGLIMNELATNALKHAFNNREEGEIAIELRAGRKPGSARFRLADNGTGLPTTLNWEKSRSLGLRLVRMLTQQLNGSLEVHVNHGTEFLLSFPVINRST